MHIADEGRCQGDDALDRCKIVLSLYFSSFKANINKWAYFFQFFSTHLFQHLIDLGRSIEMDQKHYIYIESLTKIFIFFVIKGMIRCAYRRIYDGVSNRFPYQVHTFCRFVRSFIQPTFYGCTSIVAGLKLTSMFDV